MSPWCEPRREGPRDAGTLPAPLAATLDVVLTYPGLPTDGVAAACRILPDTAYRRLQALRRHRWVESRREKREKPARWWPWGHVPRAPGAGMSCNPGGGTSRKQVDAWREPPAPPHPSEAGREGRWCHYYAVPPGRLDSGLCAGMALYDDAMGVVLRPWPECPDLERCRERKRG